MYASNVTEQLEFALQLIFWQVVAQSIIAFINFLSHFYIPEILMYSRQLKNINALNMMVIGLLSMIVLLYYRMNDAANFCTG